MIKSIVDVILSLFNKIKKKGDKTIYITLKVSQNSNININVTHFHL